MGNDFKSVPSLEQVADRVLKLHKAIGELSHAMGLEVRQLQEMVKESAAITDGVIGEMAMQIAFIMRTLSLSTPLHGGIADANGKVPIQKKTLAQVYVETGRDQMLKQIEEAKSAQNLQATKAANGQATDKGSATEDGTANAEAGIPKLITH